MGYQALLFCPDDRTARIVSRVCTELDFTVEPVHEPLAAVKQLMTKRYDAIVVDCENEQHASLLFKSARDSSSNRDSLAMALVEGQAGAAKAYRIGANFLLPKPINLEQAKGTLRVARGLLRKNSDAAGANAATPAMSARTASAAAGSSSQPASQEAAALAQPADRPEISESEAPLAAAIPIPAAVPAGLPAMAALAEVEDKLAVVPAPAMQTPITLPAEPAVEERPSVSAEVVDSGVVQSAVVENDAVNSGPVEDNAAKIGGAAVPAQNPSSVFASAPGSAAAPARAKEVSAPLTKESATVALEPVKWAPNKPLPGNAPCDDAFKSAPTLSFTGVIDAPSFGGLNEKASGRTGGSEKILIAAGVVLALAALGYLGYGNLGKSSAKPAPQAASALHTGQPAAALAPASSPVVVSVSAPGRASSTKQTVALKIAATPGQLPAGAGDSQATAKNTDVAPILVKSNATESKTQTIAEESEPPLNVASANDGKLTGFMSSASSIP